MILIVEPTPPSMQDEQLKRIVELNLVEAYQYVELLTQNNAKELQNYIVEFRIEDVKASQLLLKHYYEMVEDERLKFDMQTNFIGPRHNKNPTPYSADFQAYVHLKQIISPEVNKSEDMSNSYEEYKNDKDLIATEMKLVKKLQYKQLQISEAKAEPKAEEYCDDEPLEKVKPKPSERDTELINSIREEMQIENNEWTERSKSLVTNTAVNNTPMMKFVDTLSEHVEDLLSSSYLNRNNATYREKILRNNNYKSEFPLLNTFDREVAGRKFESLSELEKTVVEEKQILKEDIETMVNDIKLLKSDEYKAKEEHIPVQETKSEIKVQNWISRKIRRFMDRNALIYERLQELENFITQGEKNAGEEMESYKAKEILQSSENASDSREPDTSSEFTSNMSNTKNRIDIRSKLEIQCEDFNNKVCLSDNNDLKVESKSESEATELAFRSPTISFEETNNHFRNTTKSEHTLEELREESEEDEHKEIKVSEKLEIENFCFSKNKEQNTLKNSEVIPAEEQENSENSESQGVEKYSLENNVDNEQNEENANIPEIKHLWRDSRDNVVYVKTNNDEIDTRVLKELRIEYEQNVGTVKAKLDELNNIYNIKQQLLNNKKSEKHIQFEEVVKMTLEHKFYVNLEKTRLQILKQKLDEIRLMHVESNDLLNSYNKLISSQME